MTSDRPSDGHEIAAGEFIRRFVIRSPNWMWFLGAGVSAGADVPTAGNMIWDFKRLLYRTAQSIPPEMLEDLSNPAVRARIQGHFDSHGSNPPEGSEEEYAHYFEAAYPTEADRRAYIEAKTAGARPTFGHLGLAALMKAGSVKAIWETNFDPLVEDACAEIFGTTSALTVASTDGGDIALQAITEERWPLLGKLHGDFRSRRLKNTSEELREQDAKLRQALVTACGRYGLAVAGYSGRDDSVMRTLEEACVDGAFPSGLFWLHRGEEEPLPRVRELIEMARSVGVDAALVRAETFDELIGDLTRQVEDLDRDLRARLDARRQRASNAPMPGRGSGWPVVRTNALPVIEWPSVCRRIECEIGGVREVRNAVAKAEVDVLATRTRRGVLAFGRDADVHAAFDDFAVTSLDLHSIEKHRLTYDSQERELMLTALARALARGLPLEVSRRRNTRSLLPDVSSADGLAPLRKVAGTLSGKLETSGLEWRESLALHLDFHYDRLWLLIEPRMWFERTDDDRAWAEAGDFGRERFARRYNRQWNALFDAWIQTLLSDRADGRVMALQIADGVDASFRLSRTTAFSRPGGRHGA